MFIVPINMLTSPQTASDKIKKLLRAKASAELQVASSSHKFHKKQQDKEKHRNHQINIHTATVYTWI